jgi:hypothetical protein
MTKSNLKLGIFSFFLWSFFVGSGPFSWIGQASAADRVFDFEKDVPPNPPNGFIAEGNSDTRPLFIVQKEPDKQNNVLALCGATLHDSVPMVALAFYSNLKDGSVSVDFIHTGEKDTIRRAGLVWRYQSETETYLLECDTKKNVVRLVLVMDGKRKVLEDAKVTISPNEWHHLQVNFKDDAFQCQLEGKTILEKKDSQISEHGKVGIYVDSDIAMLFDNFKITSQDP